METGYKVCDAMTEKPITVKPSSSLKDCAKLMARQKVGSLVIEEKGTFIGIITEQDFVRKVAAKGLSIARSKARDIMSTMLVKISPEQDIFEAMTAMRDYNVRHLPVVDNGQLLGLVTWKDILKIEPDLFDILVEKFELREEQRKPIYRQSEKEGECQSCGQYSDALRYVEGVQACPECRE